MPDAPAPAPSNSLADTIKAKIAEIKAYQQANFAGQSGVNPFIWQAANLKPLEDELNNKGPSDSLLARLSALKYTEPPLIKGGKFTPKVQPTPAPPQGLPAQPTGVDLSAAPGVKVSP